jgi:hypothetical protein
VQGEVWVHAAQACNEVVFEYAGGMFDSISAVHTGGHKLEVNFIVAKELFEGSRALVVQVLELWVEPSGTQLGADGLAAIQDGSGRAIGNRFSEDVFAVVIVLGDKAVVVVCGKSDKLSGLIQVQLACGLEQGRKADVGLFAIQEQLEVIGTGSGLLEFGGLNVFLGLVQVAFCHGSRDRWVSLQGLG